jgi:transposase
MTADAGRGGGHAQTNICQTTTRSGGRLHTQVGPQSPWSCPFDPARPYHCRQLARSTHPAIADSLICHPQTVRKDIKRFNKQGIEGLADRPGAGRKPRLTEEERSKIIALVCTPPPGKLVRSGETLAAQDQEGEAHWTLAALTAAPQGQGVTVGRSQVRRILLAEGVRWRGVRTWTQSTDPDFGPKGRQSSPSTPNRPMGRRSSALTSWAR